MTATEQVMCEVMGSGRGQVAAMIARREIRTLVPGDEVTDEATGDTYRMISLIGEGGMGRVFRALKVGTEEVFAVKCNQAIDPSNPALMERTRNEGTFLKALRKHPHIVPVLATGLREDGVFWMVMPLLDGASVEGLLAVLGRLPLVWALEIGRAVCSALATVHDVAIHRDIKPANVYVTRTGGVYVLDFGAGKFYAVGRLTTTGTSLGTIPYMSPEQLTEPERMDGRSDLFSLGVMFFEMLSGVNPFDGDGPLHGHAITIGYRILNEEPRPLAAFAPDLPGYVYEIVARMLEKAPARRSREAKDAARRAGETFLAAQRELRSRLGEPPPIERVFDAYDAILTEREAARTLQAAPAETAAGEEIGHVEPMRSGPRAKLGTVPMTKLGTVPIEALRPAAAPVPPVSRPEPVATPPAGPGAGRTVRLDVRPAAAPVPSPPPATPPAAPAPPVVEAALQAEEEAEILRKLEAIDWLAEDDTPETRAALLFALDAYEDHPVVRSAATIALRSVGDETCLDALEERALNDPHPLVRRMAEEAVLAIARRFGLRVDARTMPPPAAPPASASERGQDGPAGRGVPPPAGAEGPGAAPPEREHAGAALEPTSSGDPQEGPPFWLWLLVWASAFTCLGTVAFTLCGTPADSLALLLGRGLALALIGAGAGTAVRYLSPRQR